MEGRELDSLKISALIPIEKNLSENLQLLLVTNFGIRLYLQFRNLAGYEPGAPMATRVQQSYDNENLVENYNVLTEVIRPTEKIQH